MHVRSQFENGVHVRRRERDGRMQFGFHVHFDFNLRLFSDLTVQIKIFQIKTSTFHISSVLSFAICLSFGRGAIACVSVTRYFSLNACPFKWKTCSTRCTH